MKTQIASSSSTNLTEHLCISLDANTTPKTHPLDGIAPPSEPSSFRKPGYRFELGILRLRTRILNFINDIVASPWKNAAESEQAKQTYKIATINSLLKDYQQHVSRLETAGAIDSILAAETRNRLERVTNIDELVRALMEPSSHRSLDRTRRRFLQCALHIQRAFTAG